MQNMPDKEGIKKEEDHEKSRRGSRKFSKHATNHSKSEGLQGFTLSTSFKTFEKTLILLETVDGARVKR